MTNQNLKEISIQEILGERNDEKSHGTRSFILSMIRRNPDGVTAQMVSKEADISEQRARVILSDLCKQREIYDRQIAGIKNTLYYPNGKLIHKYLQESKEFGSQIFRLSFHQGKRVPRLQIQERKYTLLDGEKVEGSIFIDVDNIEKYMRFLEEMTVKFNQFSNGKNKEK